MVGEFGSTSMRRGGEDHAEPLGRLGVGAHDHARGGGERVVALLARRRARVVGPAGQLDLQPQPRRQPGDDAGRRVSGGEVARLVDVQLEEAREPVEPRRGVAQALGIDARLRHRVAERDAVLVDAVDRVVDVEPPDQRARAEGRRVEARALLVGERDHGHRHALGHREAGGDAERAVEAPAAAHAVQVRADRPPRRRRVRARPQVAGRVALQLAARSPRRGARTRRPPARPRRSTPAASSPRSRRARSGRGRRAAPRARPPRSRARR